MNSHSSALPQNRQALKAGLIALYLSGVHPFYNWPFLFPVRGLSCKKLICHSIIPAISKRSTTATDKDGNKELEAGKEVTIIDTVTLEGLEVGTQYKLVGWQMLKEENAELLINGKRVESDYTFTADSETMKVEVAFTFDATSLDGKQLVTFEELYDLSNPDEPKKVTEHKDIEDKGQTITFKEKSEEPEKPETPPTPEKPNRPSDSPKTGDNTNLYGLLALLLTSGAGLASIFFYKRCKIKKS